MTPTVSLLVPVYNREKLLDPCLQSALAQTMPDLEVVVVDGASTDGTWAVCERFAAVDPRVRAFRDPVNTGPPRGWLRCLEEARGQFGTFLWSDDLLHPQFLERMLPYLEMDDVAFVFAAAEVGAAPGGGTVKYAYPTGLKPSRWFIEGSLAIGGGFPVSPACALFRLSDLRRDFVLQLPTHPPIDLTYTGAGIDQLLFLQSAARYPSVACLSEPLSFFRAHPGSLTIDGRHGAVALGYALAQAWFADQMGAAPWRDQILTRDWVRTMLRNRRFVNPATASAKYEPLTSSRALVAAAPSVVAAALVSRIRRAIFRD